MSVMTSLGHLTESRIAPKISSQTHLPSLHLLSRLFYYESHYSPSSAFIPWRHGDPAFGASRYAHATGRAYAVRPRDRGERGFLRTPKHSARAPNRNKVEPTLAGHQGVPCHYLGTNSPQTLHQLSTVQEDDLANSSVHDRGIEKEPAGVIL